MYDEHYDEHYEKTDRPFPTISQSIQEGIRNSISIDPRYCSCRGYGWHLSGYDSWHRCPAHLVDIHPNEEELTHCPVDGRPLPPPHTKLEQDTGIKRYSDAWWSLVACAGEPTPPGEDYSPETPYAMWQWGLENHEIDAAIEHLLDLQANHVH